MTNAHEGDIFVNETTLAATNATLADYVANLFPRMNDGSIQQAVALYSNLTDVSAPTAPEQAAFVMGDSIFVCPAFWVLDAFPGNSGWKVGISSFASLYTAAHSRRASSPYHQRHMATMSTTSLPSKCSPDAARPFPSAHSLAQLCLWLSDIQQQRLHLVLPNLLLLDGRLSRPEHPPRER